MSQNEPLFFKLSQEGGQCSIQPLSPKEERMSFLILGLAMKKAKNVNFHKVDRLLEINKIQRRPMEHCFMHTN